MITKTKAATVGAGAALENQSARQRIKFSRASLAQSLSTLPGKITIRPIPKTTVLRAAPCDQWRCSEKAVITNVVTLDGPQMRLCRRHWQEEQDREHAQAFVASSMRCLSIYAPWPLGQGAVSQPLSWRTAAA
jgi:hypothetical protein